VKVTESGTRTWRLAVDYTVEQSEHLVHSSTK